MNFFRLPLIIGPLPVTLVNGTTADATQVMSDLSWIVNQVNANASALVTAAVTNANNNFTTVQSGQAAIQPANFVIASQVQNNSLQTLSSVLGTNTISARVSALTLGAYVSGQVFTFIPSNANTGAATLNIDGVGARSILNMGSGLSGAEFQTYRPVVIAYDPNFDAFDLLNGTPYVQGPNIPSAATLNLDGTFGDYNQVDGTATITALTLSRGRQKLLEFNSSPSITAGASLIIPGMQLGSSYTPAPGDMAFIRGKASGIAKMIAALGANGLPVFTTLPGFFAAGPVGSPSLGSTLPGRMSSRLITPSDLPAVGTIISGTRHNTANGTFTTLLTGAGFKPKAAIVLMIARESTDVTAIGGSIGFFDGTTTMCIFNNGGNHAGADGGSWELSTTKIAIVANDSFGTQQTVTCGFNNDGITFTEITSSIDLWFHYYVLCMP
jgi:hypothetical protein